MSASRSCLQSKSALAPGLRLSKHRPGALVSSKLPAFQAGPLPAKFPSCHLIYLSPSWSAKSRRRTFSHSMRLWAVCQLHLNLNTTLKTTLLCRHHCWLIAFTCRRALSKKVLFRLHVCLIKLSVGIICVDWVLKPFKWVHIHVDLFSSLYSKRFNDCDTSTNF